MASEVLSTWSVIFIIFLNFGIFSTGAAVAISECRNNVHDVTSLTSGEFISPGYLQGRNYPSNLYCSLRIEAPKGQFVRISILDIDIERRPGCQGDNISLANVNSGFYFIFTVLCQSAPTRDFVSQSNQMQILFRTDDIRSGRGFRVKWNVVNNRSLCNNNSFQCLDRSCVPLNRKCNEIFDCPDASDETDCGKPITVRLPSCGRTPVKPELAWSDRIVGGKEAVPGSWSWQVSFFDKRFSNAAGHFCAGSLITDRWIVTAAHCFPETKTAEDISVSIGAHRLLHEGANVHIRYVERIFQHPNFSAPGRKDFRFDIALIQLSMPVNFSNSIQRICLPANRTAEVNQTCFMTGWGLTQGSGSDTILKQTPATVRKVSVCMGPSSIRPVDEKFQVCANNAQDGSGPCFGDSGGPFVCQNKDGAWTLQGITSFGAAFNSNNFVCGAYTPTVYTRVSAHLEWVNNIIKNFSY